MKLQFEPPFPLNIIIGKESLTKYNIIFKFIVLIKRAKYFLFKSKLILININLNLF